MTESEAVALAEEIEAAWNSHDLGRLATCFAVDADFITVAGQWWTGRDEIERTHIALHQTYFRDSTIHVRLAKLRRVAPGIALLHLEWDLRGHGQSGPRETDEAREGLWTWLVSDADGRAKIISAQNTEKIPLPVDHPLSE